MPYKLITDPEIQFNLMMKWKEELLTKKIEKAQELVEKMMQLEEVFHYFTDKEGQIFDFVKANELYKLSFSEFSHNVLDKWCAGNKFLDALRNMRATNDNSMLKLLVTKEELATAIEENLPRIADIMQAFQSYKQKLIATQSNDNDATNGKKGELLQQFRMVKTNSPILVLIDNTLNLDSPKQVRMDQSLLDSSKLESVDQTLSNGPAPIKTAKIEQNLELNSPKLDLTKGVLSVKKLKF